MNCDIQSSSFVQSSLVNCKITNCDLSHSVFTGSSLTNTNFTQSNIESAIDLSTDDSDFPTYDNSSSISFGSQVIQQSTGFSSVVGGGSSVRLVSGGVSRIDLASWIRVFNEEHSYRIEVPGANIRVSGNYTFEDGEKIMLTEVSGHQLLTVSTGRIRSGTYNYATSWELEPNAWCEIVSEHF
jgi:hypothetical protein